LNKTPRMSQSFAIQAKNLSRAFTGKQAVHDLSLDIREGEIYAFLGPNGAGKSTTVKMLVTLLAPTSGDAEILGHSILRNTSEVRLLIGVALQEASLDQSQTGIEFLRLQGHLYGLTKAQINSRIEELLPLVDIGEDIHKPIKTYSGGMKRRLDLAASIIHNPKILFLDEPTTGLDPISRAKVWSEVGRLNKDFGMTIFLTTQYLEEADQLADRVGIINNGVLAAEGTPQELKDSVGEDLIIASIKNLTPQALERVRQIEGVTKADLKNDKLTIVSPSGSTIVGKVALELNKEDTVIESLTLRTTTLDDVFLSVTGNSLESKDN
jgi:ABC-2 type transport system ATP-binding protein